MADKPAVKDAPTTQVAGETANPEAFHAYIPNSAPTPAADKTTAPNAPKDTASGDLNVTPIQTPGWNTDGPKAPGTPADTNLGKLDKSLESEGREDINQGQENILNAAKEAVGKELWRGTKHEGAVNGGKLGAAVSVSEVLKASGVTDVDSPSIAGVVDQLKNNGFNERGLEDAKPGDVVVYQPSDSNPSKRIGIVGDPNSEGKPTIYQMDTHGTWKHHEMRVQAGPNTKVYTPGCGE